MYTIVNFYLTLNMILICFANLIEHLTNFVILNREKVVFPILTT